MPMPAQVLLEQGVDRRRWVSMRKRDTQETGRFVDDQQRVILEEDLKLAGIEGPAAALRAAGPVHPDADDIPGA